MGRSPETFDEWIKLWRQYCQSAHVLLNQKQNAQAWSHAGFAVECALKAVIMLHHRLNRWPTKEFKPEFYSHDLSALAGFAGIDLRNLNRDPIFARWQVVREWKRGDTYDVVPMRTRVAQDILDAACGPDGVIQWLMKRFRLAT